LALSRAGLLNAIKAYMAKRGLKVLLPEEAPVPGHLSDLVDLVARDGDNVVAFSAFSHRVASDPQLRRLVNLEVARLSKLTSFVNKVYLVMPVEYVRSSVLDGRLFEEAGVGLMSVGEDGAVEEVIPARPFERMPLLAAGGDLERRLSALEDRLSKVEEAVGRYVRELSELAGEVRGLSAQLSRVRSELESLRAIARRPAEARPEVSVERVEQPEAPALEGGLPSFVQGNPWLEVLARRGREE